MQTIHHATTFIVTHKTIVNRIPFRRLSSETLRFLLRFNLLTTFFIFKNSRNSISLMLVNTSFNGKKFVPSWSRNLSYRFNHLALTLLKTHTGATLFLFSTPKGLLTLEETLISTRGGLLMGYFS